ncbi:MAG: MFS transporter [Candidatus Hodarchaeales archaeon]
MMNNDTKEPKEPKTNLGSYIFFLTGQWISILGSNIVRFGTIWFIAETTGSTFLLSLAAFFAFLPFIVATPIAGVFIDRWNRKLVIIIVDFIQAALTVILIAVFVSNLFTSIELIGFILILNAIGGIFGAFHSTAVDTLLPIMVPQKHLSRVNGVNFLVNGGIQVIGPIIGAVALKVVGSFHELLWLDAITFVIAVIPTLLITIPSVKRKIADPSEKESFRTEFSEGVSFIRSTNGLFALLAVFVGANFFLSPLFVQLPILVTDIHLGDEDTLAFIFSMQQLGMLSGSFIMTSWKGFANHAKGVAIGLFFGYLGIFIMLLAPISNFLILGIGVFITGFVLPIANVSSETIWAKIVPKDILGRVYSVRRTIAQISAPVGMLIAGILAEIYGLPPIMWIFITGGFLLLAYTWFFTSFTEVEQKVKDSQEAKKNELDKELSE